MPVELQNEFGSFGRQHYFMKLWASVLVAIAFTQINAETCGKYGINGAVLDISLEWVMQGYNIGFQGFFVELLGFAGSISKLLPQARLVKSSFKHSFDEPLFYNDQVFLQKELFPKEMTTISTLTSSMQNEAITKPPNGNSFGDSASFCVNGAGFEKNYMYVGAELAKGFNNAADVSGCCDRCYANPLCLAWSYEPNGECKLQSRMDVSGYHKEGATSGRMLYNHKLETVQVDGSITTTMQPRRRSPAPRVVVYHGTTCIHRNQSASAQNRDINTILIGRYMLERPYLVGGYNLDEYAVLHCAARMDELWVPTEWHKAVFLRLLIQQGSAASVPLITVIPEAVDTTLFDPSFARTGVSRSIVGLDRLLIVDGSRVHNGTISPDTLVVHKECVFEENRVVCNDNHYFEFLSVFKWEYRKGWDVMLNAYWAAFGPEDDVLLRVRSYVPLTSGGDRNITRLMEAHAQRTFGLPLSQLAKVVWENGVDGFTIHRGVDIPRSEMSEVQPTMEVLSVGESSGEPSFPAAQHDNQLETHLTREDMRDLLASANAFVLATRGEGWGLPVAEAMAMALPVIVTNHSGPAAFATHENAYLIPVFPELDELSFAKPDTEALTNLFRQVVHESGAAGHFRAQQKGRAARETMKSISPDSIVCKMNERIRYHAERRGWIFP